jgi:hypothetical protein
MRAPTQTDWNRNRGAVAIAVPYSMEFERSSMREVLAAVRDTMIVLAFQVVFRIGLALRRLNY